MKRFFCYGSLFCALIILFFIIMLYLNKTPVVYGKCSDDAIIVDITELLESPELYDGELVRVEGVCSIGFESNALYVSKKDYKNKNKDYFNALWLDLDHIPDETVYKDFKKDYVGKNVILEGVFNSKKHGHFGMYPATIENVTFMTCCDKDKGDTRKRFCCLVESASHLGTYIFW